MTTSSEGGFSIQGLPHLAISLRFSRKNPRRMLHTPVVFAPSNAADLIQTRKSYRINQWLLDNVKFLEAIDYLRTLVPFLPEKQ